MSALEASLRLLQVQKDLVGRVSAPAVESSLRDKARQRNTAGPLCCPKRGSLLCVTFSLSSFFPLCSLLCSPGLMAGTSHHYQLLNLHAANLPPGGRLTSFSDSASLARPAQSLQKQPSLRRARRHFLQVEQRRKGGAAGLSSGAQGTAGRGRRAQCIGGRRRTMVQCSASLGEGSTACAGRVWKAGAGP